MKRRPDLKKSLRVKVLGLVILASILLSASAIAISYRQYTNTINEHYKNLAKDIAMSAANTVNVEEVENITQLVMERYLSAPNKVSSGETGTPQFDAYVSTFADIAESQEYQDICAQLLKIQAAHDCESVYLMHMYAPDKTAIFVGDASVEDASMPGTFDNLQEELWYILEDEKDGLTPFITNYDEYGWLCSAAVPVYGEDGRVIAQAFVDISMTDVMNDCHEYLGDIIIVLGLITLFLIFIYILVIERAMVRPINAVAKAADSYIKDENSGLKNNHFDHLSIHTGDEIENLSNVMKKMANDIGVYIDNLTRVTAERERIGAELSLATEIQANYLPSIFPAFPDRTEFDLHATMDPAKEVGGDFYDFFLIDEDHLGLVMADVSGKGVPAALFMMISKTLIKNQAHFGASPANVLATVNRQLCDNNEADMFCTAWLGILEISTGILKTASAGHEYPAICRAGGTFELFRDKHGLPLGAMEMSKYKEEEICLGKGDILFVYTDGVAEATNAENELYGTDRMLAALSKNCDRNCKDIILSMQNDINLFVGDAPQFDDITMLVFRMN